MASTINFAGTPRMGLLNIAAANSDRVGTGVSASNNIIAGVAAGTRIFRLIIAATGVTTNGLFRFYIFDGTNMRFFREVAVQAITPSATVGAYQTEILTPDLILPNASHVLRGAPHNAESFNVIAMGADF